MSTPPADTCYVCGQPASSDEHVPARCFFPEEAAYRKALITVRSCATHNEDTSKDDQYVRNFIAMTYGVNDVGERQARERVGPRLAKSPGLAKTTFAEAKPVLTPQGPSTAFKLDRDRFERVMRKIGYGVYYSERGRVWERELIVSTDALRTDDLSPDELGELAAWANVHPDLPPSSGSNPDVFHHRFMEEDGEAVLQLVFYGTFKVWLTPLEGSRRAKL